MGPARWLVAGRQGQIGMPNMSAIVSRRWARLIDWHDRERKHRTNQMVSPIDYEISMTENAYGA
jgi:hypothetical protein